MTKDLIKNFLFRRGPTRSSVLVQRLEKEGFTPDAARKHLSRLSPPIRRLQDFSLPNNEAFFFLDGDFRSERFFANLELAMIETNSAYGRALLGLRARGGSMPQIWFSTATGSPTRPAKGHLLHEEVEKKLISLQLISIEDGPDGREVVHYDRHEFFQECRVVRTLENAALQSVKDWLIKLGLASPGRLITRIEGNPEFGQFTWDFSSPCYLTCIRREQTGELQPKAGFIVGDIILDRQVSLSDLKPFLSKWDTLLCQKRKERLQPVFVADEFSLDALRELRKRGCLLAFPSVVLGVQASLILKELLSTMKNATKIIADGEGDQALKIFQKLNELTGASLNLRGALLEFMAALHFKHEGYGVDVRESVKLSDGRGTDIDVMASKNGRLVCVECKGKMPGNLVGSEEIQSWLTRGLVATKEWLKQHHSSKLCRFEFWAPSGYDKEAKKLIRQTIRAHKKQPIAFLDSGQIVEALKESSGSKVAGSFTEHFIKVPTFVRHTKVRTVPRPVVSQPLPQEPDKNSNEPKAQ